MPLKEANIGGIGAGQGGLQAGKVVVDIASLKRKVRQRERNVPLRLRDDGKPEVRARTDGGSVCREGDV